MILSLLVAVPDPARVRTLTRCLTDLGFTFQTVPAGTGDWGEPAADPADTSYPDDIPWEDLPTPGWAGPGPAVPPPPAGARGTAVPEPPPAALPPAPSAPPGDEALIAQVKRALDATGHPALAAVGVAAFDGIVVLRGEVPTPELEHLARARVMAVPGVCGLCSDLAVARP